MPRTGIQGGGGALKPGTADGVTASGVIIPSGDDTTGIIFKAPSTTWGATGLTAGSGDPGYATGQVWALHGPGSGTTSDVVRARLDAAGGLGVQAMHVATGNNAPAGYAPTQCLWLNPYIDTVGLVITAPTTGHSATWTHSFISCVSDRSGSTLQLFGVDSNGIISAPNAGPGSSRYRLLEHFERANTQTANLAQIGGSAAFTLLSGTGAQVTPGALGGTAGARGVALAGTGTTTTGYCGVCLLQEAVTFTAASSDVVFGARIQIPTLSTGTQTFEIQAGMIQTFNTSEPANGLYFRLPNGGNWFAVNRRAGVETATDTGVAGSAGSWVNLKIRYIAGGNAVYSINGTIVATQSTNKPTDSTGLYHTVGIAKSAGTTSEFVYIDAMNIDVADDIDLEQILA